MRISCILLLSFFLLPITLVSQSTPELHVEFNDDFGLYRRTNKNNRGEFVGACAVYYPSGKLRIEANYENGVLHGAYKSYFKDGELAAKGNYWKGKKDGNWEYSRVDIKQGLTAITSFEKGVICCTSLLKKGESYKSAELENGKFKSIRMDNPEKDVKWIIASFDDKGKVSEFRILKGGELYSTKKDEDLKEIAAGIESVKNEFILD